MTDPGLLASLEGQQYLVLRPTGPVGEFYRAEQTSLKSRLPEAVAHPHTGHVTLRGFSEPTRVHELKDTITAWARQQAPIEVRVEAVDGFPTPFQILIARLHRTASLVDAYGSLTSVLNATDLQRIGELPLDQWTFHMSLAYCNALSSDDWQETYANNSREVVERPSELLTVAEFVWYQNGSEHTERIALGIAAD
ncbi:2'-5' RNA ligase family protein [Leifsonia sp. 22587]|uniref:2'-5' RNA ligase family protein n=1 Tax=Leifsonia sp. 22587 TaxID=3453946 RepID=UPI003F82AA28